MEVDQMAAIASSSTHPWSNVCKACIVTYHDNPTVSTHLFLPFWRKLRCGRSLLRSGPGQVAHCRSKRRHRRAWDRIAAMARWPVGHAVLYKSLPPHPSLCETWWPSCYPSASLWVITVITIGKICKCKLIFSSPMFTNVHQCSPMFTNVHHPCEYFHQGCMGWHQIGCRYWSALTRHFSWLLRLFEAVNPVKFIPIRIPTPYEPISHLYVLLPNFCADLDSQ